MASAAATNLRRISRECKSLPRRVVDDATKALQKAITKTLRADTGGDASLSGAPQKMRVQTKVTGDTVVEGTVTPNKPAMAMWSWLDDGTGEPGPTAPKRTWSDPATKEMQSVTRAARRAINAVME